MENLNIAKEIINILDIPKYEFGIDYDEEEIDEFLEPLNNSIANYNFNICNGATKVVLVSDDYNFVIKIGFDGMWYLNRIDEDDECIEDYEECDKYFEWFHNTHGKEDDNNYCLKEYEIYCDALDEKLPIHKLFAEIIIGGYVKNRPIFVQEKVTSQSDTYAYDSKPHSSQQSRDYVRNSYDGPICDTDWDATCIECYGLETYNRFREFCYEQSIGDLHCGNYGWRSDGTPVILDYAGFYD